VKVVLVFINPAGSSVKIEACAQDGNNFQIEITQDEYKALNLAKNDEVYLTPKKITYSEYEI